MNERLNTGTNTGPLEKVDELNWLILEVFLTAVFNGLSMIETNTLNHNWSDLAI